MRTVYLDEQYVAHVENADGRRAYETDFFDGKCDTFIEGCRCIPEGEAWTRSDGKVFVGEMISPAIWDDILLASQGEYDKAQAIIAEIEEALANG